MGRARRYARICPRFEPKGARPLYLRVFGEELEAPVGGVTDRAEVLAPALELRRRVGVHVGGGAHLVGVPQRARHIHALEPRHAVEVLGDQHDHVLRAALALRARAAQVSDPRAGEQRPIERPSVGDSADVAIELAMVQRFERRHPQNIVADTATTGKRSYENSDCSCGPTQATESDSDTPRATSITWS